MRIRIKAIAFIAAAVAASVIPAAAASAAPAHFWWPVPPPCVTVTFQATSNGGYSAAPVTPVALTYMEALKYTGPGGAYGTTRPGTVYYVVPGAYGTFSLTSSPVIGSPMVPFPGTQQVTVTNTLQTVCP